MNQYYQKFSAIYAQLEKCAPEMHPSDIDCAAKALAREQLTASFNLAMREAGLFESADCEAIAKAVARCEREQRAISAFVSPVTPQPATTSHR